MTIHVVRPGETLYSIAAQYAVAWGLVARWNGLRSPYRLAVGQSLLILFPAAVYTVRPGDTLYSIAGRSGISVRRLWQLNPNLGGRTRIFPGEVLVLALQESPGRSVQTGGYAAPAAREQTLRAILPYATTLSPFTYGFTEGGALIELDDERLIALAREYGVRPLLHLSSLSESGAFSSELSALLLRSPALQRSIAGALVAQLTARGYEGVDMDFEFVFPENAAAYAAFVADLRDRLRPLGGTVQTALAPKTSADQPGVLYEGHDYAALGAASDAVLLMTYEWGYTYSQPMAVAPLPSVRKVVEYALTEIPAEKILLGFPNYGYDWTLPYVAGSSRARAIGCEQAVELAVRYGAEIRYDSRAETPWFHYTASDGSEHEVWFEDVRSSLKKLQLVSEYGLRGLGYWDFSRPFTQQFSLLAALYRIERG